MTALTQYLAARSESLIASEKRASFMVRGITSVMLFGLIAATGCESKSTDVVPGKVTSEDVRKDATHAVNTAVEFSEQNKEEFQKNLDSKLQAMDAEIKKLREKGQGLKDQAKADWDKKMVDLEAKREAVHAKVIDIGKSNAAAWKDVQNGAESAWNDLDKAFHDASNEF